MRLLSAPHPQLSVIPLRATTLGATFGGTKLAQPKEALDKLLKKFPEVETLSRNLGFTPDCFTGRETHFLAQVPHREQMQALVAASEKVRALLNPIAEYDHRLEQLLKDGLSKTDRQKSAGGERTGFSVGTRQPDSDSTPIRTFGSTPGQYTREKEKSKTLSRRL
jgi:hypothetical protein